MNGVEYLDIDDLLASTRALGAGPVRDLGLLEAACARPRTSAFGADAYPDLMGKAAALLESLARNHALVDGNERLAWLATVVFLDLNDHEVAIADDDAFELVMAVAQGDLNRAGLEERLRAHVAAAVDREPDRDGRAGS